jgi:gliding motility-associated lipoprotein GldH
MKDKTLLFGLIVLVGILSSCNRSVLYDDNYINEKDMWPMHEKAKFDVNVEDTTSFYSFYILIRHTTEYPWANLQLFMKTGFPDNTYAVDTLECFLARPDGKWLGKGRGYHRDNKILLQKNVRFGQSGLHTFEFTQAMRQDPLPGIESIGLRIERDN